MKFLRISRVKMNYFSEPYTHNKNKVKDELDFFNYATKSDLQNAIVVDLSKFVKEVDLANIKPHIC